MNGSILAKSVPSYKLTLDRFGRVVVPLPIREAYHLSPGVELQVTSMNEKGFLFEIARKPAALKKTARWCFVEGAKKPEDIGNSLHQDREERDRHLCGELP